MKKRIAVIAVLLSMALLLAGCGPKPITVESFAGNWSVKESTSFGEGNSLSNFAQVVSAHSPSGGGIRINGERICQYRDFEFDMPVGDFCTFDVKDGKLAFHDLGSDGFIAFGDFEADYKLEGNVLTLTQDTTVLVLERKTGN